MMKKSLSFYGIDMSAEGDATAASAADILEVFRIIKPKASSHPLVRIGENCDGSYLVPDDLHGITACFSPGVNKIKYFEDYLTENYGIKCHMCDFSCDAKDFKTPLKPSMQTFLKKWLDTTAGVDNISLGEWINLNRAEGDLLLQMDIEGAEYRNILDASDDVLSNFRIIVLEVHGLGKIRDATILSQVISPFFRKISRIFTCVHAHPNNCCGDFAVHGTDVRMPNVLELTFVRSDRLTSDSHMPLLPNPLDVSRNLVRNPPLFLSDVWCDYERPMASKLKMLEDRMEYQESVVIPKLEESCYDLMPMMLRSLQTAQSMPRRQTAQDEGKRAVVVVSRDRRFVLSTAYGASKKTGVVRSDGNYFFHTGFGKNQYIQIDLDRPRAIRKIRIKNRLDGFKGRAKYLFAILSETESTTSGGVFPILTTSTMSGEWEDSEIAISGLNARYVTIISPSETALHFSEIEVFADDVASKIES